MTEAKTEAKRVRVDDIEIAYEEWGAGERPLLLVHGFTGSRDDWREVLPALGECGRTLAPDLRGHGDTTNPGDASAYGFERLVADLAGLLDAAGIERCDLLGHSLGGMVSLRFALAHPERVASLVLMDTSPRPVRQEMRPVFEAGAKLAREAGMSALFEVLRQQAAEDPERAASMRHLVRALGEEAVWRRMRAKLEAMDPEAFAALGLLLTEHDDLEQRLAEIRVPTLVLVGAEDEPFLEPAETLARAIADARHQVIPDAAHSPQLANSAVWLEAVIDHLERAR
jgi:pimeloyl-ACP methyl ester carboxylesterase